MTAMSEVDELKAALKGLEKDVESKAATIKHLQNALDAKSMTIGILSKANREGGDIETHITNAVQAKMAQLLESKDAEIARLSVRLSTAVQDSQRVSVAAPQSVVQNETLDDLRKEFEKEKLSIQKAAQERIKQLEGNLTSLRTALSDALSQGEEKAKKMVEEAREKDREKTEQVLKESQRLSMELEVARRQASNTAQKHEQEKQRLTEELEEARNLAAKLSVDHGKAVRELESRQGSSSVALRKAEAERDSLKEELKGVAEKQRKANFKMENELEETRNMCSKLSSEHSKVVRDWEARHASVEASLRAAEGERDGFKAAAEKHAEERDRLKAAADRNAEDHAKARSSDAEVESLKQQIEREREKARDERKDAIQAGREAEKRAQQAEKKLDQVETQFQRDIEELKQQTSELREERDAIWQQMNEQVASRVKEMRSAAEEEKQALEEEKQGQREADHKRMQELTEEVDKLRLKCDSQSLELKALNEVLGTTEGSTPTNGTSKAAAEPEKVEEKREKAKSLREQSKWAFDEMVKRINEVRDEAEAERKKMQADMEQKLKERAAKLVAVTNENDNLTTKVETLELARDSLVKQRDELQSQVEERDENAELQEAEIEGLTEGRTVMQNKLAVHMLVDTLRRGVLAPAFSLLRQRLACASGTGDVNGKSDRESVASTVEGDSMSTVIEEEEDEEEDEEEEEEEEDTYGVDEDGQEELAEMIRANTLTCLFAGAGVVSRNAMNAASDLNEHVNSIVGSLNLFPQIYARQLQELDKLGKGKALRDFICIMERAMGRCQRISNAIVELSGRSEDITGSLQNQIRAKGLEWQLRSVRAANLHETMIRLLRNQMQRYRTDYEDVLDRFGDNAQELEDLKREKEDLLKDKKDLDKKVDELSKALAADKAKGPEDARASRGGRPSMADIHKMMNTIETKTVQEIEASKPTPTPPVKSKGKGKAPPPPPPGGAAADAPAAEAPAAEAPATEQPAKGKGKKGPPPPPPGAQAAAPVEEAPAPAPAKGKGKAAPPPPPGSAKGEEPAAAPAGKGPPPPGGKGPPPPGGKGPPPPGGKGPPAPGGKGPPAPGGKGPPAPGGKGPAAPAGKGPPGKGPPGKGAGKGGKAGLPDLPDEALPAPPKDLVANKFQWANIPNALFSKSIFAGIVEDLIQTATGGSASKGTEAPAAKPKNRRLKLDLDSLTIHFFKRKQQGPSAEELAKASAGKKKKFATCLDGKRTQEIEIFLNGAGVNIDMVRKFVCEMDDKAVSIDNLNQVKSMFPTEKEEVEALKTFKETNDPNELPWGRAETFLLNLMDISEFPTRAECCCTKGKFKEEFDECAREVGKVQDCLQRITKSTVLPTILTLVLQMGNFINHGTNKGKQRGFTLDALLLMGRTCGFSDKTYSLTRFLMDTLESDRSMREAALEDMKECDEVSKISFKDTLIKLSDVEKTVAKVEKAVFPKEPPAEGEQPGPGMIGDARFENPMREFTNAAKAQLDALRAQVADTEELIKACNEMFAEKPSASVGEVMGKFAEFRKDMEEARRQNLLAKAKKEKADKKQRERDAKEAAKKAKEGSPGASKSSASSAPPKKAPGAAAAEHPQTREVKVKAPEKMPVLSHALPRNLRETSGHSPLGFELNLPERGRVTMGAGGQGRLSLGPGGQGRMSLGPGHGGRMSFGGAGAAKTLQVSSSGRISIGVPHVAGVKGSKREEVERLLGRAEDLLQKRADSGEKV